MRLHSKIMVLNAQLLMLYTLYYYQSFINWLCLVDGKKIPETIKITVKTMSKEQFGLVVYRNMNFIALKEDLISKYLQDDITIRDIRLIFNGKPVSDMLTLNDYGMKDDDDLFLVLSLNGGAPKKRPTEKKNNNANNNQLPVNEQEVDPLPVNDQEDDPIPMLEPTDNNDNDDSSSDEDSHQETPTERLVKMENEIYELKDMIRQLLNSMDDLKQMALHVEESMRLVTLSENRRVTPNKNNKNNNNNNNKNNNDDNGNTDKNNDSNINNNTNKTQSDSNYKSGEIPDYRIKRTPGNKTNDSSADALDWSHEKIKSSNLCYYCTKKMDDDVAHPNGFKNCSKKYLHYKPYEVRYFLKNKIEVPTRSQSL